MFALLAVIASLFVNTAFAFDKYVYTYPGESIQSLALRTGSNTWDIQLANPSMMGPNANRYGGMVRIPGSRFAADDVDDKFKIKINPREITKIAGQISQIGQVLGYDAQDIDDKFKIKINPREITKIAGQVAQIGQILGYDAEDVEDKKINLDEIAKIAGQTQQIIEILKSDDEFENGFGKKLRKLGRRIKRNIRRELPKVTEIAGKVAQVGQVLGYDAEDVDDKFKIKINPRKITKLAGQIAQIGQVLGYDA